MGILRQRLIWLPTAKGYFALQCFDLSETYDQVHRGSPTFPITYLEGSCGAYSEEIYENNSHHTELEKFVTDGEAFIAGSGFYWHTTSGSYCAVRHVDYQSANAISTQLRADREYPSKITVNQYIWCAAKTSDGRYIRAYYSGSIRSQGATFGKASVGGYGYFLYTLPANSRIEIYPDNYNPDGQTILELLLGSYALDELPDPMAPIPPSGQGGGQKPYNPFDTDDIDYNLLPEVSAVGTGFVSLWCPTEQQMLDLSSYMWNANPLTIEFWRKLIADPLQLVYGLNIIPLDLDDFGIVGANPDNVVVGMINTGIKMNYLTSQWVELDCGSITIDESMLGSYMDYDPYTRIDIYLPYIGYRPLRVDDFMPGTMYVKYKIDLLTGACVAQIKATKSHEHEDTLNSIVYQFMGNCATQIPVTATQYADAVRSAITTAAAIGTVALLAGAGAPAIGAGMGAELMPASDPVGLLTGPGMVPVGSELQQTMFNYSAMTTQPASVISEATNSLKNIGVVHAGASAASNVLNTKPSVQRSGAIGGAAGMLCTQTPYVTFTRPRIAHPDEQSKYTGYPSFMTKQLASLSGFTQVQAIHLEGIPCTASELAEIDALLKSGVIF